MSTERIKRPYLRRDADEKLVATDREIEVE